MEKSTLRALKISALADHASLSLASLGISKIKLMDAPRNLSTPRAALFHSSSRASEAARRSRRSARGGDIEAVAKAQGTRFIARRVRRVSMTLRRSFYNTSYHSSRYRASARSSRGGSIVELGTVRSRLSSSSSRETLALYRES